MRACVSVWRYVGGRLHGVPLSAVLNRHLFAWCAPRSDGDESAGGVIDENNAADDHQTRKTKQHDLLEGHLDTRSWHPRWSATDAAEKAVEQAMTGPQKFLRLLWHGFVK